MNAVKGKRKVGRPRKGTEQSMTGNVVLTGECAEAIRRIREDLSEETGFSISLAEATRFLVRFYEQQQAA